MNGKRLRRAVTFRKIDDPNDRARDGFVEVYKSAFAEPPYLEDFKDQYVRESVWRVHASHFLMVAEEVGGSVVGLSCAHPLLCGISPYSANYLRRYEQEFDFGLDQAVYMSDVAVHRDHRNRGIGTHLILERMRWGHEQGYSHFVMRTAHLGSHSANIYIRLGAKKAPFVQDVSSEDHVETQSSQRIYLYGPTSLYKNA